MKKSFYTPILLIKLSLLLSCNKGKVAETDEFPENPKPKITLLSVEIGPHYRNQSKGKAVKEWLYLTDAKGEKIGKAIKLEKNLYETFLGTENHEKPIYLHSFSSKRTPENSQPFDPMDDYSPDEEENDPIKKTFFRHEIRKIEIGEKIRIAHKAPQYTERKLEITNLKNAKGRISVFSQNDQEYKLELGEKETLELMIESKNTFLIAYAGTTDSFYSKLLLVNSPRGKNTKNKIIVDFKDLKDAKQSTCTLSEELKKYEAKLALELYPDELNSKITFHNFYEIKEGDIKLYLPEQLTKNSRLNFKFKTDQETIKYTKLNFIDKNLNLKNDNPSFLKKTNSTFVFIGSKEKNNQYQVILSDTTQHYELKQILHLDSENTNKKLLTIPSEIKRSFQYSPREPAKAIFTRKKKILESIGLNGEKLSSEISVKNALDIRR